MKKLLSLLLVCALLAGLCLTASAAAPATALQTIKDRIGDTSEYDNFNSSTNVSGGSTTYDFSWDSNKNGYKNMSACMTGSGIVTYFGRYSDDEENFSDTVSINRKPTAEVMATAYELVKKLNPTIAGSLHLTPESVSESLRGGTYDFSIQRYENDIPVVDDTGYLSVTPDGTKLRSFYINYTENLKFDSAANVIAGEKAQEAYAQKLGMSLYYMTDYSGDQRAVYAAYAPAKPYGVYISALTGETISPKQPVYNEYAGGMGGMDAAESAAANDAFSPAESAALEQMDGCITAAEAEKIARGTALCGVTSDMRLAWINCAKYGDDVDYSYSMRFTASGENAASATVNMNARTGELTSFNRDLGKLTGRKVTKDEARAIGEAAAKTLNARIAEYRLDEGSGEFGASYVRYVNDVPYSDDYVCVSVDADTGIVTWYSCSYTDAKFPSVAGVITPAEAAKKLFEQVGYSLAYVLDCTKENMTKYDHATLVYQLNPEVSTELDPFTGARLHADMVDALPLYTDISGHFAEKAILALRSFGIGFADETYRPDAVITQGEFVELLMAVFNDFYARPLTATSDHTAAYSEAVRSGILADGDIASSAALTRETAAVFMIRAMGLEDIAELKGIYRCPFSDVTSSVGQISILGAMGVFNGNGSGKFLPAKSLTRGESAMILYNYLSRK